MRAFNLGGVLARNLGNVTSHRLGVGFFDL
jgi:hypothetical protein